jgi:hypothetical protein
VNGGPIRCANWSCACRVMARPWQERPIGTPRPPPLPARSVRRAEPVEPEIKRLKSSAMLRYCRSRCQRLLVDGRGGQGQRHLRALTKLVLAGDDDSPPGKPQCNIGAVIGVGPDLIGRASTISPLATTRANIPSGSTWMTAEGTVRAARSTSSDTITEKVRLLVDTIGRSRRQGTVLTPQP